MLNIFLEREIVVFGGGIYLRKINVKDREEIYKYKGCCVVVLFLMIIKLIIDVIFKLRMMILLF